MISGVGISGSTVSWTTDEPATSQVEYGTSSAYGSATTPDTARTTAHSQTLSGLRSATTYHYRVISTDAAGNTATSADRTFTTPDTVAPASAASPSAARPSRGAPDEPATTQVEYGTSTAYGSATTLDTARTTAHSQTLSGLQLRDDLPLPGQEHRRGRQHRHVDRTSSSPRQTRSRPSSAA